MLHCVPDVLCQPFPTPLSHRCFSPVSPPNVAHFSPFFARSLRRGARKPGNAKGRRKNGGKRARNGRETVGWVALGYRVQAAVEAVAVAVRAEREGVLAQAPGGVGAGGAAGAAREDGGVRVLVPHRVPEREQQRAGPLARGLAPKVAARAVDRADGLAGEDAVGAERAQLGGAVPDVLHADVRRRLGREGRLDVVVQVERLLLGRGRAGRAAAAGRGQQLAIRRADRQQRPDEAHQRHHRDVLADPPPSPQLPLPCAWCR